MSDFPLVAKGSGLRSGKGGDFGRFLVCIQAGVRGFSWFEWDDGGYEVAELRVRQGDRWS